MKILKTSLLASLLTLPLLCTVTYAQTAAGSVHCKDGTTSTTTGKGACSHHGGVDKSGGAAASGSAATPATPAAPAPAARTGRSTRPRRSCRRSSRHTRACSPRAS